MSSLLCAIFQIFHFNDELPIKLCQTNNVIFLEKSVLQIFAHFHAADAVLDILQYLTVSRDDICQKAYDKCGESQHH